MRSRCTYELLEGKTCHCDAAFSGTATCDWKLDTFVAVEDRLEMGGCCSRSSNAREPTQTGVRDGRFVVVQRSTTDFPGDSTGGWSGDVYRITGANQTMYNSQPVPEDLRRQMGSGNLTIEGERARIEFRANNGNIDQYFR
ncbi:uncharacterized protein LOC112554977 isoform X2 [Pomacea canaliculata]|uniref:uncharacterized protein LOC112554977 isoform X2 n=1 Tax=Pomacea canaliculata TaxID=400727 RepID=UPI000D731B63|nr:uncharacterized protein LOC112554977 isoform X2 [Pomacea canaliculata]